MEHRLSSISFLSWVLALSVTLFFLIFFVSILCPSFDAFIRPWLNFIGTFLGATVGFSALGLAAVINANQERTLRGERRDEVSKALARAVIVELHDICGHMAGDLAMLLEVRKTHEEDREVPDQFEWQKQFYHKDTFPAFESLKTGPIEVASLPDRLGPIVLGVSKRYAAFQNSFYFTGSLLRPDKFEQIDELAEHFRRFLRRAISARKALAKYVGEADVGGLQDPSEIVPVSELDAEERLASIDEMLRQEE